MILMIFSPFQQFASQFKWRCFKMPQCQHLIIFCLFVSIGLLPAGAANATDPDAANYKATTSAAWPLPPLTKEQRQKKVSTLVQGSSLVFHPPLKRDPSFNKACTALSTKIVNPSDYDILSADFVAQDPKDPRIKAAFGSCQFDDWNRDWISSARDTREMEPSFSKLTPTEKDKIEEGVRFTANFEFYDLSKYGLPKGVWAIYEEGPIKSGTLNYPDTGDLHDVNPLGFLYDSKSCKRIGPLPATTRIFAHYWRPQDDPQNGSVFGIASISHQLWAFNFFAPASATSYQRRNGSSYLISSVKIPEPLKHRLCSFASAIVR